MFVCEMSKFMHGTYIIISKQVIEAKITVHIGFVNLCMAVTTDDNISSYVTVSEMTAHIGFLNMWDMDQFSVKEFLFISRTHDTKRTMKENQYEANRKRTHNEVNGNLNC